MSQPYLILHKVRGAPAFDIAVRAEFEDGEEYWVVSSSGHRAYPTKWWELEYLADGSDYPHAIPYEYLDRPFPEGWPDHYSPREAPAVIATSALSLLSRIGLAAAPLKRRTLK